MMKKAKANTPKFNKLREQAEKAIREIGESQRVASEDIQHLIHELQVHQIELEMQNEELRNTQIELERARNKYFDLFNFAPRFYA